MTLRGSILLVDDEEKILKALANRRRMGILKYLKKEKQAKVENIAKVIRLSVKSTSRHLRVLSAADILEKEQKDKYVYYRIALKQHAIAKCAISII